MHGRARTIRSLSIAAFWLLAYLGLILTPLAVLLTGNTPPGGGRWWDFAMAIGYAGLAMMAVQFWLTARFKRATAPFGIDIIYYFHRYLAVVAFVLLVAHAAILAIGWPDVVSPRDPRTAPAYMTLGRASMLAFLAIIATSLARKRLGLEYDLWRRLHVALAVVALALAAAHVHGSGNYLQDPAKRALWGLIALSCLGLGVWVRLLRPLLLMRRPWKVTAVRRERGRSWTLTLAPDKGEPPAYRAGQFAWLTLRASPLAMREHPFSFSSSPTRPAAVEFTIKELGDFTSTIGQTRVGDVAWVDGPYGNFTADRHPLAAGFVFVAGGVGIAPIISMLRSMADGGERRPLWLFYGNRRWDRVVFREEIEELRRRLDLCVVHTLTEAEDDWTGERGFLTREVFARHLHGAPPELHWFVCGPEGMIRLAEEAAQSLGVPARRVHSEIFDLA